MKKIIFALIITTLISANSFAQEKMIWHTDINEALEIAVKENKKVMLFFTGSDWCGWCIKLQNEVFKTSDFEKWSNDLVLVELDFPRRTPQDETIKAQNRQIQAMFKVRGYPSVYFVNPEKMPDGKMNLNSLGKTGYVRGGASKWLEVADNIVKKTI
ncbi:thioredoxin family protein [Algibacter marinivivus]|uniref:Thioredoxin family protein n=1 Tax=Algibacter marinivivus TaxID=2100723 RepID=A0A2U2X1F2_9FLAO|nr:thioredoxin family protein [Algibacter marinivivus]PWH81617.1 thioredoxin family protein [Algibacter marinivivus]